MINLSPNFQFSQSSLQDYLDCPRRFELRYLLQVKWPAPISEPVIEFEHHIQQGISFHKMVQQYFSGITMEKITAPPEDLDLQKWWVNFKQDSPTQKYQGEIFPEYRLSIPFSGFRLVGQYDLIILQPSEACVIFDWKTSRVHPKPGMVNRKIQTRLYPFLLAEAGFRAQRFSPEQLLMIYWYANFPSQPDLISYSQAKFTEDGAFFRDLIQTILATPEGRFELCQNTNLCAFCNYRSLCDRGEKAGDIQSMDEDFIPTADQPLDIDFNAAPEIPF